MGPRVLVASVVALASLLAGSSLARADGPLLPPLSQPSLLRDSAVQGTTDTWTTRRNSVVASGATGGPLGYGGLSYEYAPWRYFVLGGGAGFQPGGGTAAFTWRLRLPITQFLAVGIGAPLSTGPYQWVGSTLTAEGLAHVARTWSWATWVHIEPSIELRAHNGLVLRLYGGRSFVLDPSDGLCTSDITGGCPSHGGETSWYGGIAAGLAF
jgi:hypothetical protein